MRFLMPLTLVLLLATSGWTATGGFQGPGSEAPVNTVAQAKTAWDDTPVELTGHIVRRAAGSHEHYLFRDSTGEIVLDIDDKLFMGRTFTPEMTVRVYGEVDKELVGTKIDVKSFEIQ